MLIAMMGEPLEEDERAVFKALTGREREPLERVEGFWGIRRPSRRNEPRHSRPDRLPGLSR
jgi:hypothetical protein